MEQQLSSTPLSIYAESSHTTSKIITALHKAQSEMPVVTKTNTVKGKSFSYTYADLASVLESVKPALTKNNLTLIQTTRVANDGSNHLVTTLAHTSGEFIKGTWRLLVKNADDPQAMGSALSYARRYTVLSLLSVATADDDGQGAMGKREVSEVEKYAREKWDAKTFTERLKQGAKTTQELQAVWGEISAMQDVIPVEEFKKLTKLKNTLKREVGGKNE